MLRNKLLLNLSVKTVFFLVLVLFGITCRANFQLAMEHYTTGNYQQAYSEFDYLAKIGVADAQFNLGVMYLSLIHISEPTRPY